MTDNNHLPIRKQDTSEYASFETYGINMDIRKKLKGDIDTSLNELSFMTGNLHFSIIGRFVIMCAFIFFMFVVCIITGRWITMIILIIIWPELRGIITIFLNRDITLFMMRDFIEMSNSIKYDHVIEINPHESLSSTEKKTKRLIIQDGTDISLITSSLKLIDHTKSLVIRRNELQEAIYNETVGLINIFRYNANKTSTSLKIEMIHDLVIKLKYNLMNTGSFRHTESKQYLDQLSLFLIVYEKWVNHQYGIKV